MKQRIIILITIIVGAMELASASDFMLTKELNFPRSGDRFLRQELQSFNSKIFVGDNCLWDFSTTKIKPAQVETRYVSRTDTMIVEVENREQRFYSITRDTISLYRQASSGKLMKFYRHKPIMSFPMKLGTRIDNCFWGEGRMDLSKYVRHVGKTTIEIVGRGRMITPEMDSLRHVLLLKETSIGAITITKDFSKSLAETKDSTMLSNDTINTWLHNDSITGKLEILKWYARGYRYPIIENRKIISYCKGIAIDSINVVYYHSIASQKYDLNEDLVNDSLRQKENEEAFDCLFDGMPQSKSIAQIKSLGSDLSKNRASSTNSVIAQESIGGDWCELYPRVVSQSTTLSYYMTNGNDLEISIFSPSGVLMWQKTISNLDSSGSIECSTAELVPGDYLLTCVIGEKRYSFKFVKK